MDCFAGPAPPGDLGRALREAGVAGGTLHGARDLETSGSDGRSAQGEIRARTATRELQETIEPTGFDYALASTHLATASSIAVRDCGMPHMEERLIP